MVKDGKVIGSGGQAVVRRTSLPGLDPPDTVAVKEPQAPSETVSKDIAKSFLKKATTWQKLATRERTNQYRETDHIVGVVAIGEQLPWVAMEYMNGGSLADRIDAHPQGLPVEEALWIGECLCKGLKIAHDNGVAHLDLKPTNVLFRETPEGVWDVPKIADWGFARALIEDSHSMGAMSVEYAAPEQFDADAFGKPDSYTDIYQIGAIIYEMLTGCPPYTGGQANIAHSVIYGDTPTPPSNRREALPTAVDGIVLQALKPEKPQRYRGSVERFEDALREIRQGDAMANTKSYEVADTTTTADFHKTRDWPVLQDRSVRTSEPAVQRDREVARRVFAAEFDDATFAYSESDEEDGLNYVVTPTGARINRLFAVGALTDVESVNENVLRGRIVDPTGAFVTYAGQYQPDAAAFLERATPPCFVSLTGKARAYQPEDSGRVFTSVRPETLNEVDADTRDRWVVTAAEATLERIATMSVALELNTRGSDLCTELESHGIGAANAIGVALAIDNYQPTEHYLEAIRTLAVQSLELVAGDRDSVDTLDVPPDESGPDELPSRRLW
jgi:RPA family protein